MEQLIGVITGGVIALGAGILTAWFTARHQQNAVRAKDLWDRRATLYLELLINLDGTMSFVVEPNAPGYYGPSTPEEFQKRRELAARVDLFGSPAVRTLWEAATTAMGDFNIHVVEGGYLERSSGEMYLPDNITEPRFLELKAAMDKAEAELVDRLRHEIAVDEHLKS
ncbi:hypothetical protein AB0O39_06135 [Streptomyces anulatus]|uniref:hypothetical protein n=1 Tax=Streptomyces anulatus TaxID=1892 RepID=UPI00342A3EFE